MRMETIMYHLIKYLQGIVTDKNNFWLSRPMKKVE
jgi:hypothetical protein